MDDQQLIQLIVRQVLEEIAKQADQESSETADLASLAVVFSGTEAGLPAALEQVASLARGPYHLTAILSATAEVLIGQERVARETGIGCFILPPETPEFFKVVEDAALVLVPTLSINVLAKAALGISDSLPTLAISRALFCAKPVIAALEGANPDSDCPIWQRVKRRIPDLAEGMRSYVASLKSFGVKFVTASQLAEAVSAALTGQVEGAVEMVTEQYLREQPTGSRIMLAPRAIVTPLARDVARELNIELIEPQT